MELDIIYHIYMIYSIIRNKFVNVLEQCSSYLIQNLKPSYSIQKLKHKINNISFMILDKGLDLVLNIYEYGKSFYHEQEIEIPYKIIKLNDHVWDINLRKDSYMCRHDSSFGEVNTVTYLYGNESYIYNYTEDTKFPIYSPIDLDTFPSMDTEIQIESVGTEPRNENGNGIENGIDIESENNKKLVKMYAGPKCNFYVDIKPISKTTFYNLPNDIKKIKVNDLLDDYIIDVVFSHTLQ